MSEPMTVEQLKATKPHTLSFDSGNYDTGNRWEVMWTWRCSCGLRIGVSNPRMEPDYDEDGYRGHYPDWDGVYVIDEDGERRTMDSPEDDFHSDQLSQEIRWQYSNT